MHSPNPLIGFCLKFGTCMSNGVGMHQGQTDRILYIIYIYI